VTGPFALAASARLSRRFREISHPVADAVTRSFVERAARADSFAARSLRDLRSTAHATREAAAWRLVAEELAVLSVGRDALADSAGVARQRIVESKALGARIPSR
jgi:hypothetical protein